jgi:hypothetical protein
MNPKFFGDTLDLFKYDLIFSIMNELKNELSVFTFIPMLTKNHPPKKKDVAGMNNTTLWNHFNKLFGDGAAGDYFKEIQKYFESEGIRTKIYSDIKFSQSQRENYFKRILLGLPRNPLIFFDPDTGLKETDATEKHLKYSELREIYKEIDDNSILMIYQHFYRDRTKYQNLPEKIASRVEQDIDPNDPRPLHIDNNTIMFLFLTRNPVLREKLKGILNQYTKTYVTTFTG